MKFRFYKWLLFGLVILSSSFTPRAGIELISMDLTARTLFQGKSVTGTGTLYYKVEGSELVTKMNTPVDQVVFTNAIGEYKSYDIKENKVILLEGEDLSSKKSFIYQFLNGQTNDLGLRDLGFKMINTRFEDDIMINEWQAPSNKQVSSQKVEIAFENYLPIYVGFFDADGGIIQKTYYTNYQDVLYTKMPFTITEISYRAEGDSAISRKTYSNLKLNGNVTDYWLNYKIPENAEVIVQSNGNSTFQN
ncbi:MAG TPA: hypothetical protein DCR48_05170 [Flavobacteriales bacterium]|nr:hypothetical protein [Flavobacteriales bacterium]